MNNRVKTKKINANRPIKSDAIFTVIMCVLIAIASIFYAFEAVKCDMREHPECITTESEREFAYGSPVDTYEFIANSEPEEDYTSACL